MNFSFTIRTQIGELSLHQDATIIHDYGEFCVYCWKSTSKYANQFGICNSQGAIPGYMAIKEDPSDLVFYLYQGKYGWGLSIPEHPLNNDGNCLCSICKNLQ